MMRSYWIRLDPKSNMTGIPIKQGNLEKDAHRRETREDEVRDGVTFLQEKKCQRLSANHQKLEERHGTDSRSQSTEGTTLLTPQFQTPNLWNWKMIRFCHLGHLVCTACCGSPSELIYYLTHFVSF